MKKFSLPLRFSIPAILVLLGTLLSIFSFQTEVALSDSRTEKLISCQVRSSAEQTSEMLEYLFHRGDIEDTDLVIKKFGNDSSLQLATVSDENNKIIVANRHELKNQYLSNTVFKQYIAHIQKVRQQLSGEVIITNNQKSILAIYPVILNSFLGKIRSTKVGILLLEYDLSPSKHQAYMDALEQTLEVAGVLALSYVAVWLFLDKSVTRRAVLLVKATNCLAKGNLAVRTKLQGCDELAQISIALDDMADQIQVNQRDQAELYAQSQHATAVAESQAHKLSQTLYELQQTQAQLIQTEKMSSLGQLVAGIAHEINNPVNFIFGNLLYANDYFQDLLGLINLYQKHHPNPDSSIKKRTQDISLDYILEDLPKLLSSMQIGADRIREIVLTLRNFSRLDEAEMKPVNIHEGIDSTLVILYNRLKGNSEHPPIQIIKHYGDLPKVECYAGQLNQVFMNIISNAIDALYMCARRLPSEQMSADPLTITIATQLLEPDWVSICIKDNGCGIAETTKRKIFDHFFTTKPVGEGTGLGLSISYQIIVDKHGGGLKCVSAPGQGAEFWIQIPIKQSALEPLPVLAVY